MLVFELARKAPFVAFSFSQANTMAECINDSSYVKQICECKCRIFFSCLGRCSFDLLTVTFQGQNVF